MAQVWTAELEKSERICWGEKVSAAGCNKYDVNRSFGASSECEKIWSFRHTATSTPRECVSAYFVWVYLCRDNLITFFPSYSFRVRFFLLLRSFVSSVVCALVSDRWSDNIFRTTTTHKKSANARKKGTGTAKSFIISAAIVNRKISHFQFHFVMRPTFARSAQCEATDIFVFFARCSLVCSQCHCLFCIRKGKSSFFKIKDISLSLLNTLAALSQWLHCSSASSMTGKHSPTHTHTMQMWIQRGMDKKWRSHYW